MTTSAATTLRHLVSRLHEQAAEVALLRMALDVQSERIAHLEPEQEGLPHARTRRQALRPRSAAPPTAIIVATRPFR